MREAIFQHESPSFEEVMYWRKRSHEIDFVVEQFLLSANRCFKDVDAFFDSFDYDRCLRSLSLILYFRNTHKALPLFTQVLKLNHLMHRWREDLIYVETCEFLERWVRPEHEQLLLNEWNLGLQDHYRGYEREVPGCFPYIDFPTKLLLKIDCKDLRIIQHAQRIRIENYSDRVSGFKYCYDTDDDPDYVFERIVIDLVDGVDENFSISEFNFLTLR